jgi:hypothetical protein
MMRSLLPIFLVSLLAAQQTPNALVSEAKFPWTVVRDNLVKMAEKMPAEPVAALKQSYAVCDSVFDSLTDAAALEKISSRLGGPFPPDPMRTRLSTLYNMIRHSNEMYGYMRVYLRLKGIVPPSSAPE